MESQHWAKVTAGHISRFGELTKREIQVISFLFLCRNGKDLQCNPDRKTIAAGLGWPPEYKSHVSTAISGLESKGWIYEQADGNFHLFAADDIPPAKVTKSVTKVTKSVTAEPVTKSVTEVTESVTNGYQIGNAHIKDLEQTTNRELTDKAPRKSRKRENPLKFSKPVPIPEPFELSDEMLDWIDRETPGLRVADAMADFREYWTNKARGKNALAKNWRLRWEKGMRLMLTWQRRDDAAAAKTIEGKPADWRTVGRSEPEPAAAAAEIAVVEFDLETRRLEMEEFSKRAAIERQQRLAEKARQENEAYRRRLGLPV